MISRKHTNRIRGILVEMMVVGFNSCSTFGIVVLFMDFFGQDYCMVLSLTSCSHLGYQIV